MLQGYPVNSKQASWLQKHGVWVRHAVHLDMGNDAAKRRVKGLKVDPADGKQYHVEGEWPSDPVIQARLQAMPHSENKAVVKSLTKWRNVLPHVEMGHRRRWHRLLPPATGDARRRAWAALCPRPSAAQCPQWCCRHLARKPLVLRPSCFRRSPSITSIACTLWTLRKIREQWSRKCRNASSSRPERTTAPGSIAKNGLDLRVHAIWTREAVKP